MATAVQNGGQQNFKDISSAKNTDLMDTVSSMKAESRKTSNFLKASAECNTVVTGASVYSTCLTNNNKEVSKLATKAYTAG
jgi:hypothetical protein